MIVYNTKEQSQFIKNWLCENKDVISARSIGLRAGVEKDALNSLLCGKQRTISQDYINKLLPVLYKFGFNFPDYLLDFETIICEEVSLLLNETVKPFSLYTKSRKKQIVYARNLSMLFRNKILKNSLAKASEYYNKDHTTLLNSRKVTQNLLETDANFRQMIVRIEGRLGKIFVTSEKN